MELFKKLDELMSDGMTVVITIAKSENGLSVSVLPGSNLVKDGAKNKIQPLAMTGTAEDFDNGFEDAIGAPLKKSLGLLSELKDFEDSVEEARKASEMEKKAKQAEEKTKADIDGWIKLAEANLEAQKYKDAKTCLAEASKLAVNSDTKAQSEIAKIKARIEDVSGGLFANAVKDLSDGKMVTLAASKKLSSDDAKDMASDDDIEDND